MRQKLSFLLLFFFICIFSAYSQIDVKGVIVDKDTKEPLIGVTIYSTTDKKGTTTDLDGSFLLKSTKAGVPLKITYIGYLEQSVDAAANLGTIEMVTSSVGLNDVVVTSSIAIRRKTPVALSVIEPEVLEAKLANQEFPEILKSTPSVYATKQGGGYGDSRITLRGFDTQNTAVMVNGVPMNDMEWGGVYWSNWTGLTEVTRSMQVQRGLGAAKVAAPSIGGSINIVTKSTDAKKGGSIYYGVGNDGEEKISFSVSTGLTKNGWAMTLLGTKNWGSKYAMGTEFEAYTWFLNISKIINENHQLSLTAFGSPQWHNQRNSNDKLTILEWKKIGGDYTKFNANYGYDKNGERVNPNKNRYHKPQISLNHSWTIDEKSSLSSVLYVSIGDGGGNRWRGANSSSLYGTSSSLQNNNFLYYGSMGTLNMEYRDPNSPYYRDYTKIQEENAASENGSKNVISESINNHTWVGLLSTYTTQLAENIDFYGGIDLRYYEGLHQEKIKNLMGGEYYLDTYRKNNVASKSLDWVNQKLGVNDKIYRDNTGYVVQEGLFAQAEYNKDALSTFISASVSNNTYWKKDRYYYDNEKSKTKSFIGYNLKGGANYNIDTYQNVFFNMGYLSRAPFFRGGYFANLDQSNVVNKKAVNEKSYSFEVGYGVRSQTVSANLNLYYTKWLDKTMVRKDNDDGFMNMKGIDARHMGVELEVTYKPTKDLTLKGMASIGDWIWDSKAQGTSYDRDGNFLSEATLDIKNVKVNNSPQTTFNFGVSYKCFDGLTIGADYTYAMRNYADYVINVPNPGQNVKYYTPWRIPSAGTMDLNMNYRFDMLGFKASFFGNINNVFNKEYITDARDYNATSATGHSWQDVGVIYGFGRTWWTGLKLQF